MLILALLAETNRAPFDLTEAEQELTQGYMTEYSGMKFALFMMAEYLGMIAVSLVAVAVFFGGYHLWPMDGLPILAPVIFIGKVFLCLCGMIWIRATLPRIRYDRLMQFWLESHDPAGSSGSRLDICSGGHWRCLGRHRLSIHFRRCFCSRPCDRGFWY